MLPDSSVRLNKYISESGICSRREADRYIEQGNVFLNGKRATIGDQVKPGDVVKVNGQLIEPREAEDLVLIALNKPVGIVSTTEDGERDNIGLNRLAVSGPSTCFSVTNWLTGAISVPLRTNILFNACSSRRYSGEACIITRYTLPY